jgi:hypothetical protein
MKFAAISIGIFFILVVLWDAFETIVLPRRVTRRLRLVRLFYRLTWPLWTAAVRAVSSRRKQENYLSYYGPLSLPVLLGIWAAFLIVGFALLYWAPGNEIRTPDGQAGFTTCLYFSGTTFFTLGLGDVSPNTTIARTLVVLEGGMGFAFLALVISYLPALNQSFSRREVSISLLDARAGSPPTAAEILRRHFQYSAGDSLTQLLHEWERWSAELLESHLSYPVLVYFRSQHDNQSWLAALTAILDTCSFVISSLEGKSVRQAQLTFAMARHVVVDLALVLHTPPHETESDRLPAADLAALQSFLKKEGMTLQEGAEANRRLNELRRTYEPYVHAMSKRLRLSLPPWISESGRADNWQVSAWGRKADFKRTSGSKRSDTGHF